MPIDWRRQRALRLAWGTAICLTASFGLGLPVPILAPIFAVLLLAARTQPLPLRMAPILSLMVLFSAGSGLLLIPLLRYAAVAGVLLVGVGLFLCFRFSLRGGNSLLSTFLVIGLTMVSSAGVGDFTLALSVVEAMAKGMLLAVLSVSLSHHLFPEPLGAPDLPTPPLPEREQSTWIALRATFIVLPAFLLALIAPQYFMPLVMKSVSLGQQSCETSVRQAGRELVGSTLMAGILAISLWSLLSLFVHLWMFFLLGLLFALLQARRLYKVVPTRQSPGYWVNCLSTMLILLGQSVQDSAMGEDVYRAFAVRMLLFLAVALYACAMVYLLESRSRSRVGDT